MGCLGAFFGSLATQILTDMLTFSTFESKSGFYCRKEKVDFKSDLDEMQAALFTWIISKEDF